MTSPTNPRPQSPSMDSAYFEAARRNLLTTPVSVQLIGDTAEALRAAASLARENAALSKQYVDATAREGHLEKRAETTEHELSAAKEKVRVLEEKFRWMSERLGDEEGV